VLCGRVGVCVCVWVRISVTIQATSLAQITSAAAPDCIHFSCFTGAYAQNQHQRVTSAVTRLVEWWTLWGEESLVLLLD